MNKQSEFIINKITDHFGLWEEQKVKKKKSKSKKQVLLSDINKVKPIKILESEIDRARKKEIQFIKEQILLCSQSFDSEIKVIQTQSTKNRQAELIYAKEVLFCEVSLPSVTFAS